MHENKRIIEILGIFINQFKKKKDKNFFSISNYTSVQLFKLVFFF